MEKKKSMIGDTTILGRRCAVIAPDSPIIAGRLAPRHGVGEHKSTARCVCVRCLSKKGRHKYVCVSIYIYMCVCAFLFI